MPVESAKYLPVDPASPDARLILTVIDGVEWHVPDDLSNRFRQMVANWEEEGNSISAADPAPAPDTSYVISKDLPWRRMNDTEATNVAAAMKTQSPRFQMIYDGAPAIRSSDELYTTLKAFLTAVIGASRAEDVLAPE